MKKNGVLCAVDVNDYDPGVLKLAAQFALHYKVDLDVVHVSVFPDPGTAAWPAYVGSSSVITEDNAKLRELVARIEEVAAHPHHLSGTPTEQLIDFVERNEPRLLVIGTHGRKGMQRIFGSVASKVLRNVNCPVLVLRQKQPSRSQLDSASTN